MRSKAAAQARTYLVLLAAFLSIVIAVSLYANLRKAETQYRRLAGVLGRSFYQSIAASREWNIRRGGVYVPVTKEFRPNALLRDSMREVTTREGLRLTKVNHAQMIREISNLLKEERGIRVRITSRTPIRAANAPDAWEGEALRGFTGGKGEAFEVLGTGNQAVFRFMSPLKGEPSCVACHPEHKDPPGNFQGGVSVTFSWVPFQRLMDQSARQIWTVHLAFLAVSLLLIFFLGRKLVSNIDVLQDSLRRIRALEGLVPICANCKKIRNEGADPFAPSSWTSIEKYLGERTEAEFTHGLCPECAKILYPGVDPGAGR